MWINIINNKNKVVQLSTEEIANNLDSAALELEIINPELANILFLRAAELRKILSEDYQDIYRVQTDAVGRVFQVKFPRRGYINGISVILEDGEYEQSS